MGLPLLLLVILSFLLLRLPLLLPVPLLSLSVFLSFLLSPLHLSLLFLPFSHLLSVNLYGCSLLVVAVSLNVVSRMRIPCAPRTETSSAGVLSNDYGRGNFSIRQSGTTCYLIGTGARVYTCT